MGDLTYSDAGKGPASREGGSWPALHTPGVEEDPALTCGVTSGREKKAGRRQPSTFSRGSP